MNEVRSVSVKRYKQDTAQDETRPCSEARGLILCQAFPYKRSECQRLAVLYVAQSINRGYVDSVLGIFELKLTH